jgi:hypothetical protein
LTIYDFLQSIRKNWRKIHLSQWSSFWGVLQLSIPLDPEDRHYCPATEEEARHNEDFCADTGIMNVPGEHQCYRQVPHNPGGPAFHCCYTEAGTLSTGRWGAHFDEHSPVEGRNCDDTCNYNQWGCIVHLFCDTIPGWF